MVFPLECVEAWEQATSSHHGANVNQPMASKVSQLAELSE